MAKVDLEGLTVEELESLKLDVEKAIVEAKVRRKKEALAAVQAQAREFGFDLKDLVNDTPSAKSPRSSTPAKYRHPENDALTWSGRGRKPAWFTEALEQGMKQEDLLI